MMREDQSNTLKNQVYMIAGTCQQGCRQLSATLRAYGSKAVGICQQPHNSRCSNQINVEV